MSISAKKIFFFDLDGTLLTSSKQVSEKTMEALKKFTDAGNHFCINTGRAIDSAKAVASDLGLNFKGSFLCGSDGTEIFDVDKGEYVYKVGVPLELIRPIFDLAKKYDVHIHAYTETHLVSLNDGECMKYYRRVIKTPLIITDDILKEVKTPPSKLLSVELHDHDKQERFREALHKMTGDVLTTLYSNPYYLEIFPAEAGKGSVVKRLSDYLEIPIENTYAAGDEENDISMLQAAGCGIAMINGKDNVKACADVITKEDNDHDGLAEYILGAI
ncbi:Cof-type HAD-IIB family hydrolase [Butyrivibrio sp. INlla21]|uniref:Cof-type HAD-IIB family hydrolase n=1 Tax=Butyrivibrio sp. INlla21 TaxID=1520811 RepID=UPI0008E0FE59|nr:Cof-type HAD-IIB family hydrolase [Butyrivibrio sp. INlla21]SFU42830.1 hypothetical protein SAMN02910342_00466 [Butyrivibrio sp. INlla21]